MKAVRLKQIAFIATLGFTAIWFRFLFSSRNLYIEANTSTAHKIDTHEENLKHMTSSSTTTEAAPLKKPPELVLPIFNNQFHVLVMLSVFNGKRWPKYDEFTDQDLVDRDKEYLSTLRANLENKVVKEVHLFYTEDDDLKLVKSQNFSSLHKLRPVKWHRRLHMADFFLYASKNLVNKSVIAINGDILISKGFDLIDTEKLRDERVMFSLTRHNIIRDGKKCTPLNLCTESYYRASHDTHVFRLAEPLNETIILDKLDYPINMWGAENAMHWTFKFALNYTIRNPCKILVTHHNHCSKVHGPSLEQVKKNKYSIYYLPNKGWTRDKVLDSYSPFEEFLAYGKEVKSSPPHTSPANS